MKGDKFNKQVCFYIGGQKINGAGKIIDKLLTSIVTLCSSRPIKF